MFSRSSGYGSLLVAEKRDRNRMAIIWSAPWAGIYFVNILLHRNRYDVPALYSTGAYGYARGFNIRGLVAFGVGMVCAALFANAPIFQGPFVRFIGGGDISIFTGFFIGGGLYYLLMRNVIRATEPEAEVRTTAARQPV